MFFLIISVCILNTTNADRYWRAEGAMTNIVGSHLTLTCEPNYMRQSSHAGAPVTRQNITCLPIGDWSQAENCILIRKFKSILLTIILFDTLQPGICYMLVLTQCRSDQLLITTSSPFEYICLALKNAVAFPYTHHSSLL